MMCKVQYKGITTITEGELISSSVFKVESTGLLIDASNQEVEITEASIADLNSLKYSDKSWGEVMLHAIRLR